MIEAVTTGNPLFAEVCRLFLTINGYLAICRDMCVYLRVSESRTRGFPWVWSSMGVCALLTMDVCTHVRIVVWVFTFVNEGS